MSLGKIIIYFMTYFEWIIIYLFEIFVTHYFVFFLRYLLEILHRAYFRLNPASYEDILENVKL